MNTTSLQTLRNGLLAATLFLMGASDTLAYVCGSETPAVDRKVFPATLCQKMGTTGAVQYDHRGRILNPSATDPVTVVCPIVRDASTAPWASVDIILADRNPTADITCQVRSSQEDGAGWWYPSVPVKTSGAKFDWWNYDKLKIGAPVEERDFGTFSIMCTLPPKYQTQEASSISSYRTAECSDQTNPG